MNSNLRQIRAFKRISGDIGTAGQPTEEQFADIRAAGYEVVINLLPFEHQSVPKEAEIVAGLGMEYANIPVVWSRPTRENVDAFFEEMDRRAGRSVFVHCAANMRAASLLFVYRVVRCGVDRDEAEEDLYDIWFPEGCWAELIESVLAEPA